MNKINIGNIEFRLGDMSKEDILKEVLLPIVNGEYKRSELKWIFINTLQETDNMELR